MHKFLLLFLFTLCSCGSIFSKPSVNPAHEVGSIRTLAILYGDNPETRLTTDYLVAALTAKNEDLHIVEVSPRLLTTVSGLSLVELKEKLQGVMMKRTLARSLYDTLHVDALLFPVEVTVERHHGNVNFFHARTNIDYHYELTDLSSGERVWTLKKLSHLRTTKKEYAPSLEMLLEHAMQEIQDEIPLL